MSTILCEQIPTILAREYNPRYGVAYWGKFEDMFPEIGQILKSEFGLVDAYWSGISCLVSEENGRGLWHVHFAKHSERKPSSDCDTIAFEYWCYRAIEQDYERDPMRHAAKRVYDVLKPYIEKITTVDLDIEVSVPWAKT